MKRKLIHYLGQYALASEKFPPSQFVPDKLKLGLISLNIKKEKALKLVY